MDVTLPTLVLALTLAVLVGVSLGLLGGGGSILTVPLLVYVLGLPAHEAIATSLLVVGTTSIAALVSHAKGGRVKWQTGALFGAASMVGAYAAGRVAKQIPATALLLLFGGMMLLTAIFMMRGPRTKDADEATAGAQPSAARRMALIALEGLVVGAFTGLVGAGGGFLVVPALVLLGGLDMRDAVGTSLLVIAMKSFAGFAGYLSSTPIDWTLAAMVTLAAVVGSFGGARLAGKVPPALLRRGFAWFVVVMAVFILSQEVPKAFGVSFTLAERWPIVLGLVSIPLVAAIVSLAKTARTPAASGV
jgi:uncharacterized protein